MDYLRKLQEELEESYNQNNLNKFLKIQFEEFIELNFKNYVDVNRDFIISVLVSLFKLGKAKPPTIVGILSKKYPDLEMEEIMGNLTSMCEADLIDYNTVSKLFSHKYTIDEESLKKAELFRFPMPMVCKPKEVCDNTDTGYTTWRKDIVSSGSSEGKDYCLDFINKVNQVALVVTHLPEHIPIIQEDDENSFAFKRRQEQDLTLYRETVKVYEMLKDNVLHFTHFWDGRGRIYCRGYHLNYQGDPMRKSMLELEVKEYLEL